MDFSKYKKVKEDKNSTTMQSDKGHTITLMHSTMPRIQVEQLKRLKMGDGGRVGLHIPEAKKMADGGDPAPDSTGTDDSTSSDTAAPDKSITINVGTPPAQGAAPQSPASGVAPTAAQPVPYQSPSAIPATAAQYAGHSAQFQSPEAKPAESNIAPSGTLDPNAVARNTKVIGDNQQAIDTAGARANTLAHAGMLQALSENAAQQTNAYNDVAKHTADYAD
jgi:hypothetical protein